MTENIERINKIKTIIEEDGAYTYKGTEMNINIMEDVYESIEDEVMWVIEFAKEQAEKVKQFEEKFNINDNKKTQ